jgi:hypothetical protein
MGKEGDQPRPLTFETVTEMAVENTLRDGHHAPTLIVEGTSSGLVIPIDQPAPTSRERAVQLYKVGVVIGISGEVGRVKQVFFVFEAWMSSPSSAAAQFVPPSQDPNRKEVLVVTGLHAVTRKTRASAYEMLRDTDHTLRELRPWISTDDEGTRGEGYLLEAFLDGVSHGEI